jgi:hypothetical protein
MNFDKTGNQFYQRKMGIECLKTNFDKTGNQFYQRKMDQVSLVSLNQSLRTDGVREWATGT